MRVLITGGAGFIGSHLADRLLEKGFEVRVLDNLDPQVHGQGAGRPEYLNGSVELVVGDIRDHEAVSKALDHVDLLVHFAAAVGVGQSMYRMEHYTSVNALGASVVLEEAVRKRESIGKMLVASSMSIYGEGLYRCGECGNFAPSLRPDSQLSRHQWEVVCPDCGGVATPLPVPESKPLHPTSIYAVNKRDHEEMFLAAGHAYKIPATALRFFNVYGTRQSLSNPYTGVAAIFASRILNDKPPVIFEDGLQSRDFIHVRDLTRACAISLESDSTDFQVLNVGTGMPTTILDVARAIEKGLGRNVGEYTIRNQFRAGDIRHCFADISRISQLIGFSPEVSFQDGMTELCGWVASSTAEDRLDTATKELEDRGLTL